MESSSCDYAYCSSDDAAFEQHTFLERARARVIIGLRGPTEIIYTPAVRTPKFVSK